MSNCTNKDYTGVAKFHSRHKPLLLLLAGLLLSSLLSACSYPSIKSRDSLASEAFGGTIVDKETGKPIANAVVLMWWPRRMGGYAGSNTVGTIEVAESVTNSEGRYYFAGWRKDKSEIYEGGFVYKSDPEMIIYASGYWPAIQRNRMNAVGSTKMGKGNKNDNDILLNGEPWKADWDGESKGIKPMHFEDWNPDQWQKYIGEIDFYFPMNYLPQCAWLKLPHFFLARDRVIRKSYQLAHPSWDPNIGSTLRSILTKWRPQLEKECGVDPKPFFLNNGMTKEEFEQCCSVTLDNKDNTSVM